jgi:tetratricopeptide (TPR) repeat protein
MSRILLCLVYCFGISSCGLFSSESNTKDSKSSTTFPEVNAINASIEKNPKDAALYFKRGQIYHQINQDSLALMDFQTATKLDSTQSKYFSAVGDLLFEHKDISGSIQWIQKAIALNPDDEIAHLKMGKLFMFTEEYPKAFVEINTVLRTNVYNAEAYFLKGMCYKNMKDTAKAISSFQTAVQTEPRYVDAHMQLALIFEAKKDPIALNYFENAYKSDSSDLEPLYGQIMFWQNQGKYTDAKKVIQRIVSIDRTYAKSYYNMGWMLLQEDSTEKAIRQFGIAIQEKPDYVEAYYNRGLCYEIEGKLDQAKEDYNQALTFNPDYEPGKTALQRVNSKK